MIESGFLASLRRRHRAELVLVLVQLEQRTPGWWPSLEDLADQLGTDRATLNRSIRRLETLGLLRRESIGNTGGTWVWWAKRSELDEPDLAQEPAWVLRHVRSCVRERVSIRQRWEWARARGIPRGTMRGFLAGQQRVLREQWELVSTPLDVTEREATWRRGCDGA